MPDPVPRSHWARQLDWDLHVTFHGEPCTPFSLFVRQEGAPACEPTPTFLFFYRLPAELQLRILRFCDAPALFGLMQASPTTRTEAAKLFWSIPDAWYRVDGPWLLEGAFPGHAHYSIPFLANVQRLEVEFNHMKSLEGDWEAGVFQGKLTLSPQDMKDRIRGFWSTLQRRFPNVTNVVVSESRPLNAGEPLPPELQEMVQLCPDTISASASFLQESPPNNRQLHRRLWHPTTSQSTITPDDWTEVDPEWTRTSILLPHKQFRGPVGAFERANYWFQRYRLQTMATRWLLFKALESCHFHKQDESPFPCPAAMCNASFAQPGEWTLHALATCHDQGIEPPALVKPFFRRRDKRLRRILKQDIVRAKTRMYEDWGEDGGEKRRIAEEAFLHQLEHDPLYEHRKSGKETIAWSAYVSSHKSARYKLF